MTDAAEQAEWDSDNGSYLAGLKGVTIPGTAPRSTNRTNAVATAHPKTRCEPTHPT